MMDSASASSRAISLCAASSTHWKPSKAGEWQEYNMKKRQYGSCKLGGETNDYTYNSIHVKQSQTPYNIAVKHSTSWRDIGSGMTDRCERHMKARRNGTKDITRVDLDYKTVRLCLLLPLLLLRRKVLLNPNRVSYRNYIWRKWIFV